MRKLVFHLILIVFAIVSSGCTHSLDIRYNPRAIQTPNELSPEGTNIYLAPIEDIRSNKFSKGVNTGFVGIIHTYAPIEPPVDLTRKALTEKLKKYGVIEQNKDGYRPTSFGIRVFFLRIDPKTADLMHEKAEKSIHGRGHTSGILHMITSDLSELPQIKLDEKFVGELTGYNYAEKLYKEQDLEKKLYHLDYNVYN